MIPGVAGHRIGKKRALTRDGWRTGRLHAFRPTGKQIAFNSRQGGTINVWTAPVEGGPPRQLTFDKELMGFPCWSPDGKFLAFEIKRGDDSNIGIIPSGGGTPIQLTSDHGQSWSHDWSPDGDKIAVRGAPQRHLEPLVGVAARQDREADYQLFEDATSTFATQPGRRAAIKSCTNTPRRPETSG